MASSTVNPPPPPTETYQPSVRVMRLYKPGFHMVSPIPYLPSSPNVPNFGAMEMALSPFALLPDSFGDIFSGEKFSAYIAVVNGYPNVPFYQVSLAIRLQTASLVLDLNDIRSATGAPAQPRTLNMNDSSDMIVQHTLNELGTHTLRVSVQYLTSPTSEPKTLRKFYRFNVLQPLVVTSHFIEVDNKPMVQCQVTNTTKSPIYIDEMKFNALNKYATVVPLQQVSVCQDIFSDDWSPEKDPLILLQPDESYGFAFIFTKYEGVIGRTIGYPEVRWCTTMGEFSVYKGEDTGPKIYSMDSGTSTANPVSSTLLKIQCLSAPAQVTVGEEFDLMIRIKNNSSKTIPVKLQCPSTAAAAAAGEVASSTGLCFTGLTHTTLGNIDSGETMDATLTVYALSAGLHDLPIIYGVDAITKEKYASGVLCKIFVNNTQ